jgi:hypothetical protein
MGLHKVKYPTLTKNLSLSGILFVFPYLKLIKIICYNYSSPLINCNSFLYTVLNISSLRMFEGPSSPSSSSSSSSSIPSSLIPSIIIIMNDGQMHDSYQCMSMNDGLGPLVPYLLPLLPWRVLRILEDAASRRPGLSEGPTGKDGTPVMDPPRGHWE